MGLGFRRCQDVSPVTPSSCYLGQDRVSWLRVLYLGCMRLSGGDFDDCQLHR